MSATQKRVWPELVGKDVNSAVKTLKEESGLSKYQFIKWFYFLFNSDIANIRVMRDDSKVTCTFDPTQITVFVNEKNIVTVEPRIG